MKTLLTAAILLTSGVAWAQPSDSDRENKKPPTAEELIAKLDKDGDGKISSAEFDGPDEHFTQFDKNEDGYLSTDEIPSKPPQKGGRGGGAR